MTGLPTENELLRIKAVKLSTQRKSENEIARICKKDKRWVRRTIGRFNELGHFKNRPSQGGISKLTPVDETNLINQIKEVPHASLRKVAKAFQTEDGEHVSPSTIRRLLKSKGLYPHRFQRSPRLTQQQKEKRVEFAKQFRRKSWEFGVFWDEKEFELFGPLNRKNDVIWSERGKQYIHGEVAHPSKFKIAAAISSRGATRLVPYEGSITSNKYQSMLKEALPDIIKMYPNGDWFLVQDSATCHTSQASQEFLDQNVPDRIRPIAWPANSPDINPIENVFGYQQDKVNQKSPKTLLALKKVVQDEWGNLSPKECAKFISAVPKKLKKIIENQGEYVLD
jgi:transposase